MEVQREVPSKGYDFTNYSKSFRFGGRDSLAAVSLDLSLANLFQKLTVECRGVLGNPQWKHYRHMQLLKNDQIRLSNGIWRSWHIQFQKGCKPKFCKFAVDPEIDVASHKNPQSVVIEGKYWKRTRQAVANEYRKWRLFYKKKNAWSNIKRIPANTGNAQQQEGQAGGDIAVQADLSNTTNRFSNTLLQGLEDFPDLFMNVIPRPGDERTYMRPLVESAEMLQPNLDMLNPTLDDLLDHLEPMEVIFPSFNGTGMRAGSVPPFAGNTPPSMAPPSQGVSPSNMYLMSDTGPAQYRNQSDINYGSSMTFMTPPNKTMDPIPEEVSRTGSYQPMRSPYGVGGAVGAPPINEYHINPSGFLNPPVAPTHQEVGLRPDSESMDLGPGHTHPSLHPQPKLSYQTSIMTKPTPLFTTDEAPPSSIMYDTGPHPPVTTPQSSELLSLYNTYPEPSLYIQQQQQQQCEPSSYPRTGPQYRLGEEVRGVATGTSPTYSKGSVEPNMQLIAEQMKRLEEEQLEQIREIEKQQSIASQQYLLLLEQYVSESGEQPTQQQQKDLAAVLSNPASVQILKSILTHDGSKRSQRDPPSNVAPPLIVKQELVSPQQSSLDLQSMATEPVQTSTPSQLVKASGVSDFQSRLLMAAAAQACSPSVSPYSAPPTSEGGGASYRTRSPDIHENAGGVSPALLKKFKNARNLTPDEKKMYQELRRQSHITAEQKRRGSIKNGFEQLQSLVINPTQHPSAIEYLESKHTERDAREKRIDQLKEEISNLNQLITSCQQQLPASGVLVTTRQRNEENRQHFKEYVQQRTNQNYKFWIYSIILQHLFESYNSSVSSASPEVLCQSVLSWCDQNCSLPALRPVVMSSLKELSVKTTILSDPSKLPEQLSQYGSAPVHPAGAQSEAKR
ncbi:PREDICTED: MLX-interacting protein-like isoform X2 [Amphimedon queenslandica]|uniref:BHLH domain-containing protein n=1 Tax=Amphimedon queenslandica TaxID=400682 RepID=A0AAN0IWB3_AMPQE|nr:PREDICTED: MLX-interacting protein-like isoform X2 [Amphimedon queenslandica]|eukprot:XP_019848726.1 PREDICTED: MLX-interacting protein-like isoform X2 [Amphimedon queenslandica]